MQVLDNDIHAASPVRSSRPGIRGVAARLFGARQESRAPLSQAERLLATPSIAIGVIGSGKVGTALLEQLREAIPRLRADAGLDLRVRALANSRHMWLDQANANTQVADGSQLLRVASRRSDLGPFAEHVRGQDAAHAVIIDCSASDAVAAHYPTWLASGIHVVTPNKQAGAGPLDRYQAIRQACSESGARFRYEATVGAGLPVIQTLRDLIDTGDQVRAIEGIFSGTLAWLFYRYDGSQAFSQLIHEALELGYTEPDPRDDLSGTDVARKLVILAREAGLALSLHDVQVESLVPASLAGASATEFLARLSEADAAMAERRAGAVSRGKVLRHVARMDEHGHARVGVEEIGNEHAFAHLRLTDNIVQFSSRRYSDNPLVVQGPGAGPEVTAAGVFADLLRVCAGLGARL